MSILNWITFPLQRHGRLRTRETQFTHNYRAFLEQTQIFAFSDESMIPFNFGLNKTSSVIRSSSPSTKLDFGDVKKGRSLRTVSWMRCSIEVTLIATPR